MRYAGVEVRGFDYDIILIRNMYQYILQSACYVF